MRPQELHLDGRSLADAEYESKTAELERKVCQLTREIDCLKVNVCTPTRQQNSFIVNDPTTPRPLLKTRADS